MLYGEDAKGVLNAESDDTDEVIFAAWSQQWPRLRRSFSFRTARVVGEPAHSQTRFDLRLARGISLHPDAEQAAQSSIRPWEHAALEDLLHGPTSFRRFLWRYGSDQRRGRERFRFLADIYAETRVDRLSDGALRHVLNHVIEVLPLPNDGKLLKEDLVSAGQSSYSLLPATDPLDVLDVFASGADRGALSAPPEAAFEAVHQLWSERPSTILAIAERAVRQESPVADQVLERLAAVAAPETFLSLSWEHPTVRARLIEAEPTLLDSPDLANVGQPQLNRLLNFISDSELAIRIVGRLIKTDDPEAARLLVNRFSDEVEAGVFHAMTQMVLGQGPSVPSAWQDAVRSRNLTSLPRRLLGRVTTTGGLAACAMLLKLDLAVGLAANPAVWAEVLVRAHDDVGGQARQKLMAYLLALALAQPTRGCEPLFERSFEAIHSDLWSSRLPQDAFDTLIRVLPDVFWWEQWDTCLRLRLGTVNAYVNAELDPRSFRRLTRDGSLFKRLVQLAGESKQGRRFLKQVTA